MPSEGNRRLRKRGRHVPDRGIKVNRMLDKDKIDAHVEAVGLRASTATSRTRPPTSPSCATRRVRPAARDRRNRVPHGVGQKQQYEKLLKAIKEYKG